MPKPSDLNPAFDSSKIFSTEGGAEGGQDEQPMSELITVPKLKGDTLIAKSLDDLSLAELVVELNAIHNLSDAIYEVRDSACENERWGPCEGNPWEHPMVKRYSDILTRVMQYLAMEGLYLGSKT